jgi:hypothetical protein
MENVTASPAESLAHILEDDARAREQAMLYIGA